MKRIAKISGKKLELSSAEGADPEAWTFESRPGGWMIATRILPDGTRTRTRVFYSRVRQGFSLKISGSPGLDVRGERVAVSRGSSKGGSASDYTAQFPGKVRKIAVKEGEVVTEGAPLILVEAMKMEFAIKAGSSGLVKKILVTEGMQLAPGQALLEFEEKTNG